MEVESSQSKRGFPRADFSRTLPAVLTVHLNEQSGEVASVRISAARIIQAALPQDSLHGYAECSKASGCGFHRLIIGETPLTVGGPSNPEERSCADFGSF